MMRNLILLALIIPAIFALTITPEATTSYQGATATIPLHLNGINETISSQTISSLQAANGTLYPINAFFNLPQTVNGAHQGTLTFSTATLPSTTYTGQVNITTNLGTSSASISLTILTPAPQHAIVVSNNIPGEIAINRATSQPTTLSAAQLILQNNDTQSRTVNITLSQITNGQNIINVTSSASQLTLNQNQTQIITFTPQFSNVTSGTYVGQAQITYDGASKTVPISIVVRDASIAVTPRNNTFPQSTRNVTVNTLLRINNTGDFNLTNINITLPPGIELHSPIPSQIIQGAEVELNISTYIPLNRDSGSVYLGDVLISSDQGSRTFPLFSNAVSRLEVATVRLFLEEFAATTVSTSSSTFGRDAFPGYKFTTQVELRNDFATSEDVTIEDISIEALFEGIDEGEDDIEGEEQSTLKLKSRQSSNVNIKWDRNIIHWDAQSGQHAMKLLIQGEDENGAIHTTEFIAYINVKRNVNEDIRIIEMQATPQDVMCSQDITLSIYGRNIGQRADKQVRLVMVNTALGIMEDIKFEMGDFNAEECDAINNPKDNCREFNFRKTYTLSSNLESKVYPILIKTYHDHSTVSDEETLNVRVVCANNNDENTTTNLTNSTNMTKNSTNLTNTTTNNGTQVIGTTNQTTTITNGPLTIINEILPRSQAARVIVYSKSIDSSPLYTPLLLILIFIVVGGITTAITALRK